MPLFEASSNCLSAIVTVVLSRYVRVPLTVKFPWAVRLLNVAFPLSFRMTCYYYRKFYYRSFFLSPPGCAVEGIKQKNYKGETGLLTIQNLHRYTLYIAILYILISVLELFRLRGVVTAVPESIWYILYVCFGGFGPPTGAPGGGRNCSFG